MFQIPSLIFYQGEQVAEKVMFTSTNFTIQGSMLREVVLGRVSNGLYHVQKPSYN